MKLVDPSRDSLLAPALPGKKQGGQLIFEQIIHRNDPQLNKAAKARIYNQVFN